MIQQTAVGCYGLRFAGCSVCYIFLMDGYGVIRPIEIAVNQNARLHRGGTALLGLGETDVLEE